MSPSRSPTPATGWRRGCLVLVALVLCSAWAAPALASPGSVPTGTPVPHGDPGGENRTAVTAPSPTAPDDDGENVTGPVRTAVPSPERPLDGIERHARTAAPDERRALGPPVDRVPVTGTATDGPTGTVTATPRGATGTERAPTDADTTATDPPTTAAETPTPATGGDADGGGHVPAGLVLVGLAGGAGAAAGLGLAAPQSGLGHSPAAVRNWVDDAPRLLPAFLGRFGREEGADPLSHPHRETLHEVVTEQPGAHLGQVVDEVPLSRSSVRHHVRVLEDAGALETAEVLGRRRLFPPDADSELVAALADEGSRRVVRAVQRVGPAPVGDVVDETGRAYSTVSYHLDRLAEAGAVTRERDGRQVTVRLTDEATGLLASGDDVAAD